MFWQLLWFSQHINACVKLTFNFEWINKCLFCFYSSLPPCPLSISGHHPLSYLASLPLSQPLCHAVSHFDKNRKQYFPAAPSFQQNNAKWPMWQWKTSAGNDLQVAVMPVEKPLQTHASVILYMLVCVSTALVMDTRTPPTVQTEIWHFGYSWFPECESYRLCWLFL